MKPTKFFGGKYMDKSVLVCADNLGIEVEKMDTGDSVIVTGPGNESGSKVSVVTRGSGSYLLLVMLRDAYEKGLAK